jgi:hypothetical protein
MKKFHATTIKAKPGMALIQGVENDVVVSGLKIPATSYETTCKDSNDCFIKVGSIDVILNENNGNILFDVVPGTYMFVGCKFKADDQNTAVRKRKIDKPMDTPKPRTALLQEGENVVVTPKATTIACMDTLNAANIFFEKSGSEEIKNEEDIINLISPTSDVESPGNIPKLRTTLIQGREDDERMAPNLVASIECQEKCTDSRSVAGNLSQYPIQFGTFSFDGNIIKNMTNWVVSSWRCGEDQLA